MLSVWLSPTVFHFVSFVFLFVLKILNYDSITISGHDLLSYIISNGLVPLRMKTVMVVTAVPIEIPMRNSSRCYKKPMIPNLRKMVVTMRKIQRKLKQPVGMKHLSLVERRKPRSATKAKGNGEQKVGSCKR